MAAKTGTGLMAVWADIAPEVEAEFNEWYDTEHIPERMKVPGFLSGVRYTAIEGFLSYTPVERPPKYLVLYELADENVVTSEAYLKLLKSPTPWTHRGARYCRNNSRCVYRQILTQGNQPDKTADSVLSSCMNVAPEHESEFNEWYNVDHLPALVGVPGVICARRYVAIESEPKYLVIYQLKDAQVLKSEAWHRARNSDWTKRMRVLRRDVKSGVWRHIGSPMTHASATMTGVPTRHLSVMLNVQFYASLSPMAVMYQACAAAGRRPAVLVASSAIKTSLAGRDQGRAAASRILFMKPLIKGKPASTANQSRGCKRCGPYTL